MGFGERVERKDGNSLLEGRRLGELCSFSPSKS